ncbi:MAG: DUF624 domain-containing protein [Firmicutes bacterium]|nr:DUF624 domain-containing protein [Bacillota bacterium]
MSATERRPSSWPLALRSFVGGGKLAYEYLGLTLVHSLLWFLCHLPFLMIAWSAWTNLSANVPEEGKLVYVGRDNGHPVLVLADQNGKGADRFPLPGLAAAEEPTLSPDGKRVAFVDQAGRLCLFETESGQWRVLRAAGRVAHPSFGPDGRTLVFALAEGNAPADLYLREIESGTETRLTETPAPEADPSFAPDGKSVVFVRPDEDGNEEIWVMKLTVGRAGSPIQLTRTRPPVTNRDPVFSPDGRYLAFCSFRQGRTELYLLTAEGRGEVRLTQNDLEEELPRFSSTGNKIFFVAGEGARSTVYFVPAQGGMVRRLGEAPQALPWGFVFLLLVVTGAFLAAPANAAMVFVRLRCAEEEPRLRDFFLGFRRHYFRAAAVYGTFLFLLGILLLNISLALKIRAWFGFLSVILSLYTILFLLVLSPHLFPLVVLQPNTFRKVWKKAFLLALDNLMASGFFVLLTVAAIAVAGFTGILLVLFYPAVIGHAGRLFFQALLARYEDAPAA